MGVKCFEVVKLGIHTDNQWSPDEIRVWQIKYHRLKNNDGFERTVVERQSLKLLILVVRVFLK